MKTLITLSQEEIIEAIHRYVEAEGVSLEGMDVDIAINAVRSPTGYNATVQLEKAGAAKKRAARRPSRVTPAAKVVEPTKEVAATEVAAETVEEAEQADVDLQEELQSTPEEDAADDAEVEEVEEVTTHKSIFDAPAEEEPVKEEKPKAAPTSSSSLFD